MVTVVAGKPHIPYRNSKLTRILQESLGGNSKTMMLVACSPAQVHAPETHSTMRFATRAKRVRNAAVVNRVLTADQLASANAALKLELNAARARITALEEGAPVGVSAEAVGGMDGNCASAEELDALREQVEHLEQQLDEAKAEIADEQREVASQKEQLGKRHEEREMLYDTLARFQVTPGNIYHRDLTLMTSP